MSPDEIDFCNADAQAKEPIMNAFSTITVTVRRAENGFIAVIETGGSYDTYVALAARDLRDTAEREFAACLGREISSLLACGGAR